MIPTIKDLMREKAIFDRYEDGELWYHIMWFDNGFPRKFEFPVPVDMPDIYEVMQDAANNLENLNEQNLIETKELLEYALDKAKRKGAGSGQFRSSEKVITLMRWVRKYIDYLNNAKAIEDE